MQNKGFDNFIINRKHCKYKLILAELKKKLYIKHEFVLIKNENIICS